MSESRDPGVELKLVCQEILDLGGRDFVEMSIVCALSYDDYRFPLSELAVL